MKKLFLLLLATLTLFSITQAEEPALPTFEWERDAVNHWQLDETGAIIVMEPHTLDEMLLCTGCGSEIWLFEDGYADVNNYDEYGNLLRYTSFDANGTVLTDIVHAYEYNQDGIVLVDREFYNGVFISITQFTVNENGEQIPVITTTYNEDNTVSVNEYDDFGNVVRSYVQDEQGVITVETISEYLQDDDGWFYEAKNTTRFIEGAVFYREMNQYGDTIRVLNTEADGTVWADSVYEYEYIQGVKRVKKQYSFGRLAASQIFDEEGSLVGEAEYLEDGSKILSVYDDQGNLTITTKLADDTVVSVESIPAEDEDMSGDW